MFSIAKSEPISLEEKLFNTLVELYEQQGLNFIQIYKDNIASLVQYSLRNFIVSMIISNNVNSTNTRLLSHSYSTFITYIAESLVKFYEFIYLIHIIKK